ncbi:MAG: LamG domain-containing protein [Planctomycetota bacterium]
MKTKRMKRIGVIGSVVVLLMARSVVGALPWWLGAVQIYPQNPTRNDVVAITLSGEWPDSCVPNDSGISLAGQDIYFDVFQPGGFCFPVCCFPWQFTELVGPLPLGTYTVYAQLSTVPFPWSEGYVPVAQFDVTVATYYVDAIDGNDNNDGLSLETAFATIQKGINTTQDDDIVLVYPGLYTEPVSFLGKAITVRGVPTEAGGPIIQAPEDYAVSFEPGQDANSVLDHFVIRNSEIGVFMTDASPTISFLTIVDNNLGIAAYGDSEPDISNCIFHNNNGHLYGAMARWVCLQYDLVEPGAGIISHWKFEEGAGGVAYDSAGGNDGTIYGASWTTGQIGGALEFDDTDDYVEVPDAPSLRFSQYDSFSISFWARPLTAGWVLSKMRASNCGSGIFSYQVRWHACEFAFVVEKSCTGSSVVSTLSESAPAENWYHVTCVYDNKDMKIYLDGELRDNGTFGFNTGSTTPDKDLTIGARSYDSTIEGYLGGKVDAVAIYAEALREDQVWRLYHSGLSPQFADPNIDDYHLLSERGRYRPSTNEWILDAVTCPCVDVGDLAVEPSNERMPNGGRINVGAYGNTCYASMSEWPLQADVNRDGRVNWKDIAVVAGEWLTDLDWAR